MQILRRVKGFEMVGLVSVTTTVGRRSPRGEAASLLLGRVGRRREEGIIEVVQG